MGYKRMKTLKFSDLPELEQGIVHERSFESLQKSLSMGTKLDIDKLARLDVKSREYYEIGGNYFIIDLIRIK